MVEQEQKVKKTIEVVENGLVQYCAQTKRLESTFSEYTALGKIIRIHIEQVVEEIAEIKTKYTCEYDICIALVELYESVMGKLDFPVAMMVEFLKRGK